MRPSSLIFAIRLTVILGFIVGPVLFASYQQKQMKNFRVVREGVLYRSGQMTADGMKRVIHDYGIRTVVTLRDAKATGEAPPDAEEEAACRKLGLKYVRITPRHWSSRDGGPPPVEAGVQKFVDVMRDPGNYPVLVHCFAGTHRTGAYCAVYRMEFEGWGNERAIEELKSQGYPHVEDEKDIFGFLSGYRPKR